MFEIAILLGVLAALVRRADLMALALVRFRGLWFCFVAFALKVALFDLGAGGSRLVADYGMWLQLAVTLTLLSLVAINLHLPGMRVVLVGLLANLLVISINGGKMPVTRTGLIASGQPAVIAILEGNQDPGHVLAGPRTHLIWLGDWIPLAALNHKLVSPGDILAALGLGITVGFAAPARKRKVAGGVMEQPATP